MRKVLVVTGGASGIGAATARLAAKRGFAIAINFRTREAEAARIVEEIRSAGGSAVAIGGDCTNERDVENLFETAGSKLGVVTGVVNSAGVDLPTVGVADVDAAQLATLLMTNVFGVMLCCRAAVKVMSRRLGGTGGVVVNVSSMAATIGGRPGSSHYAASKAAVDAFSIGMAKEVAQEGIRVLSVRPGMTVTEMTKERLSDPSTVRAIASSIPLGRVAQVDEVAAPIVWLLSDEASFVTGTCLDI
jgi:NAD(P)-dependent dehydrogenase (short-subunit alcohol dehydrogenase family)